MCNILRSTVGDSPSPPSDPWEIRPWRDHDLQGPALAHGHRAGRGSARLADVLPAGHMHINPLTDADAGPGCGQARREEQIIFGRVAAISGPQDNMRSRLPHHVKPEVVRPRNLEGEPIVLPGRSADQDDETRGGMEDPRCLVRAPRVTLRRGGNLPVLGSGGDAQRLEAGLDLLETGFQDLAGPWQGAQLFGQALKALQLAAEFLVTGLPDLAPPRLLTGPRVELVGHFMGGGAWRIDGDALSLSGIPGVGKLPETIGATGKPWTRRHQRIRPPAHDLRILSTLALAGDRRHGAGPTLRLPPHDTSETLAPSIQRGGIDRRKIPSLTRLQEIARFQPLPEFREDPSARSLREIPSPYCSNKPCDIRIFCRREPLSTLARECREDCTQVDDAFFAGKLLPHRRPALESRAQGIQIAEKTANGLKGSFRVSHPIPGEGVASAVGGPSQEDGPVPQRKEGQRASARALGPEGRNAGVDLERSENLVPPIPVEPCGEVRPSGTSPAGAPRGRGAREGDSLAWGEIQAQTVTTPIEDEVHTSALDRQHTLHAATDELTREPREDCEQMQEIHRGSAETPRVARCGAERLMVCNRGRVVSKTHGLVHQLFHRIEGLARSLRQL